jgi:hypothetical protein
MIPAYFGSTVGHSGLVGHAVGHNRNIGRTGFRVSGRCLFSPVQHEPSVPEGGCDRTDGRTDEVDPEVAVGAGGQRGPEPASGIEARPGGGTEDHDGEAERSSDRDPGDVRLAARIDRYGGALIVAISVALGSAAG